MIPFINFNEIDVSDPSSTKIKVPTRSFFNWTMQIMENQDKTSIPYVADIKIEISRDYPMTRFSFELAEDDGLLPYKTYSFTSFLPHLAGTYKITVNHAPKGYIGISESRYVVAVPPIKHKHERYGPDGFPYHVGALSMLVGFVIFSTILLHHREDKAHLD
jgi:hypothetical protein